MPSRKTNARRHVLVVDDVEDNRDIYATYLQAEGFDVQQAVDGEQALACVAKKKPDAIVMDLSMPRVDGWEATRRIKSNPQTKDVVVLIVTGHAMSDEVARARELGADDVCTKPCLPQEVVAHVRRLLAR
jgi:two-component system, cell cycle response regulator DivK